MRTIRPSGAVVEETIDRRGRSSRGRRGGGPSSGRHHGFSAVPIIIETGGGGRSRYASWILVPTSGRRRKSRSLAHFSSRSLKPLRQVAAEDGSARAGAWFHS